MGSFDFNTQVRKSVEHILQLTNPIDIPVQYTMVSDLPGLLFEKTVLIDPYSMVKIKYGVI